ncbi:protein SON isoform X2 [Cheilinus undulatus]|uniref:protein SON isoform X2 n=1 Tax=Cheilinus undulatus TaxID=241271 RepID=UPI001BD66C94|nr:protein SON isoform X2 [Cheilinus undulatus]
MAANLEQIFQDFILNKIREIEDQKEDKAAVEAAVAGSETTAAEKGTSEGDKEDELKGSSSHKKHKKHKKHKSKKKKKNREKESSSESDGGTSKTRRGTPTGGSKERGEANERKSRNHKRHSSGKRKKKKRRRKDEENSSDSDSESKQRESKSGQKSSPKSREELPDIIPKQDSSSKLRGDKERRSCRRSRSQSHSRSHSHSHSERKKSHSPTHNRRRSRSRSLSSSKQHQTRSRSPEKREFLDGTKQVLHEPPKDLELPQLASSPPQINIKEEEVTELRAELRSSESQLAAEKKEDTTENTTEENGSGACQSRLSESIPTEPDCTAESRPSQAKTEIRATAKSPEKKKRKPSRSPQTKKDSKSSKRQKRSKTPSRSRRRGSRSRSRSKKRRSRSRSGGRRSRRSRSRSRRRTTYSQRDRWKREPSHSPVLILRKNRSPNRKHGSSSDSPQRINKEQLLEIAKANAAAMCAKAGMPIPAGLRSAMLPLALPSMAMNAAMASMTAATMTAALTNMGALSSLLPLPSITNKPPAAASQPNMSALEEVKRKVAKQANSISIKEFTDKCKMIVDSKGELPVALPHVSDEEDEGKPFGASALKEQKAISFSINNTTVRPAPAVRSDAGMAKEFPVSSGSQHRKKEGETLGVYGEWVPVEKSSEKASAPSRKATAAVPIATTTSSVEVATGAGLPEVEEQPAFVSDSDSVFPDPVLQPVDISQAVTERIKAQRRLAENPYDVSAICMLSRAQEQVDAWAQSNTVPGLFTGSTGAQVLSSEELSTSGPQAWLKKDQFLRAAPVSGGVGEFLMRKMGWKTGEGLGRNREGTVEPIIIDFKVDRKGLVAEGEKPQKQTGGLVVTKDLMGNGCIHKPRHSTPQGLAFRKHPVSALIELCNKRRIMQPDFVMVHHSGPDHRKNFLFKVTVNGVDYQPQTASPNKKHAKAMAATVALQALGEVPVDGPGLYTGPVFTAASTGPLFST